MNNHIFEIYRTLLQKYGMDSKAVQYHDKGISLNVISIFVEYFDDELFYVNPMEMLDFLKGRLGDNVVVYHDYVVNRDGYPYEITFHAFKHPS